MGSKRESNEFLFFLMKFYFRLGFIIREFAAGNVSVMFVIELSIKIFPIEINQRSIRKY